MGGRTAARTSQLWFPQSQDTAACVPERGRRCRHQGSPDLRWKGFRGTRALTLHSCATPHPAVAECGATLHKDPVHIPGRGADSSGMKGWAGVPRLQPRASCSVPSSSLSSPPGKLLSTHLRLPQLLTSHGHGHLLLVIPHLHSHHSLNYLPAAKPLGRGQFSSAMNSAAVFSAPSWITSGGGGGVSKIGFLGQKESWHCAEDGAVPAAMSPLLTGRLGLCLSSCQGSEMHLGRAGMQSLV